MFYEKYQWYFMRILQVHPLDPMQIHRARTAKPQHPQIPDPQKLWEESKHLFLL